MPDEPVGVDDLEEVEGEAEVPARRRPVEFGTPLRRTVGGEDDDHAEAETPRQWGVGEGVVTIVVFLIGICGFRSLFSHSIWQFFILVFAAALVIGAFAIISGYRATRKEPEAKTETNKQSED